MCEAVALPPIRLWFSWHFEGLERIPAKGPALLACNHISYLDPLGNALAVVKAGRRPRFLAKQELFSIPLVGRALRGAGQIPVDRGTPKDPAPLTAAEDALGKGEVVVVYPEGTVTKSENSLPMEGKTGAVRLALATGLPITPMASWGSQAVWQKAGKGSLKFGRPIWMGVGERIDLSAHVGRENDREALRQLTATVMTAITELVVDLRDRYPSRWSAPGEAERVSEERARGFTTRAIHAASAPPIEQDVPSVPIFQTSTFRFDTSEEYAETISFRRPGFTYTRGYGNPTLQAFESVMADLEGTESAMSFASGMAAMHAVFTTLAARGYRVVTSRELYGGAYSLFAKVLPRYGIEVAFVDPHDLDGVRAAVPGAAFFYVETIANPNVTVADLEALGSICADAGTPSVVDNTFASPYLCTPAAYGFDFVVHSTTKFIGGHHDLIGGVVCCSEEGMRRLRDTAIDTGGTMAPFEAWLCMRSLMTLEVRMERHCATAAVLAEHLEGHGKVERVRYPGLASHPQHQIAERLLRRPGSMMAIEVAGGAEGGQRFCDALELAWVATSLGGVHTLVGHAASTTHRQLDPEARRAAGIADGLVRVSVGLEDPLDLLGDVDRALEKV